MIVILVIMVIITINLKNETLLTHVISKIKEHHVRKLKIYQQLNDLQQLNISAKLKKKSIKDLEKILKLNYTYVHPIHQPENYVNNIQQILQQTSEDNCLSQYTDFQSIKYKSYPTKHPGNKVFDTFSDFIDEVQLVSNDSDL